MKEKVHLILKINILLNNEIGLFLEEDYRKLNLKIDSYYTFSTKNFRELNVSLIWKNHCWSTGIIWKTQQQAFNFYNQFNLIHNYD